MTSLVIRLAISIVVILFVGCSRDEHPKTPGEAAGHAAYEIEKDSKKAAKEVSKDLKSFAHDAKEGFQDAKEKDKTRRSQPPADH